jgi:hypothetical protein
MPVRGSVHWRTLMEQADIAIIGAGAAGLAAGIFAAENAPGRRIVLLDGAKRIGAKILVSGGGRCNVTHDLVRHGDFHGSKNVVRNVLKAFDEQATVRWMASLGVQLKREETGKLFPTTDQARTVLDALLDRCSAVRAEVRSGCRVRAIEQDDGRLHIAHEQGKLTAERVILCTGGRSLPRTGSDGQGYAFARRLGHTVSDTHAALVPLVLDSAFFHATVSGVSQEVDLTVFADGKRLERRTGSLLWTHFGVSGPVAMDASRAYLVAQAEGRRVGLQCSLVPGRHFDPVEQALVAAAQDQPRRPIGSWVAAHVARSVGDALLGHLRLDPAARLGQLRREDRRTLVRGLTELDLPVQGHRGWNHAEVTAGGVPLAEIDWRTMGSRCCPGLHLAGEILDCDGRIGGFNFQWAWATGHLAGRAAAAALQPTP